MVVRCAVTMALDQQYLWATLQNSHSYASVENVLNLPVVTTNTANSLDDLRYALEAAECLWDRYARFEAAAQTIRLENLDRRVGYEDAALETIGRSIALRELIARNTARLAPDNPVLHMNARIQLCRSYLGQAVATRRIKYPFGDSDTLLARANTNCTEVLQDLVISSGTTSQSWFELKNAQITGNLGSGASEQAAQAAIELVAAWVSIGNDPEEAMNHVSGLVEHEVSGRATYQQHLDRLSSERGW